MPKDNYLGLLQNRGKKYRVPAQNEPAKKWHRHSILALFEKSARICYYISWIQTDEFLSLKKWHRHSHPALLWKFYKTKLSNIASYSKSRMSRYGPIVFAIPSGVSAPKIEILSISWGSCLTITVSHFGLCGRWWCHHRTRRRIHCISVGLVVYMV